MGRARLVRLVVALTVSAIAFGAVVTVHEHPSLTVADRSSDGTSAGAHARRGQHHDGARGGANDRDRRSATDRDHRVAHDTDHGTAHDTDHRAGQDASRRPGADRRFHRFRLDAVDGTRLVPNRDDLAARTVPNGPLLLFLPATRAQPSDYTAFLTAATNAGYHVLGLDYWNLGRTLSRTCAAEPHCYTQVQRNRFDGTSPSAWSDVQPTGSIISRLRTALTHLDDADPAGGWGRFVRDGRVQWQHVVVAGHSQGGSQAAYIGHVRRVDGVLMFGAPAISDGRVHAAWLDRPGRTPVKRYYALAHRRDAFGPRIRPSWSSLALDGAGRPFRADRGTPVGDPHALLTDIAVPPGTRAHSVVVNDHTPRDALGNPQLLPVWNWMLRRFDVPLTHPQEAVR